MDREQGGPKTLTGHGIKLHCLFKIGDVFDWMREENLLSEEEYRPLREYIDKEKQGTGD